MQANAGQMSDASHTPQINPYAQDASALAATSMFSAAAAFAHPVCRHSFSCKHPLTEFQLSYHLYAPLGPHRENLMAYQRTTHDFFIPDHLREEMQRKSEASLQTFSSELWLAHIDRRKLTHYRYSTSPTNRTLSLSGGPRYKCPEVCISIRLPKLDIQGYFEQRWLQLCSETSRG